MYNNLLFQVEQDSGIHVFNRSKPCQSATGRLYPKPPVQQVIKNNYLITNNTDDMVMIDFSNPASPVLENTIIVGPNIETIFPFKGNRFIDSTTTLYVCNLTTPANLFYYPLPAISFHSRSNFIRFFSEGRVPADKGLHRDAASLPAGFKIIYRLH